MADIPYEIEKISSYGNTDCRILVWPTLASGDTGKKFEMPGYSDRSLQVTGDFGVGASADLEGSNDGQNWSVLTDPQGGDLKILAGENSIEQVMEVTRYVRPHVVGGDIDTELTFTMLLRKR